MSWPNTCRRYPRGPKRQGSTYLLVVGAAMIVSVLGMAGLMVARLQLRQAAQARDWSEAGDLALSGLEQAIARINATPAWRTTFSNNTETSPIALGNGTMSFKLVDAALGLTTGDSSLNNNNFDPVRLYGIGRVGSTVRVYSVLLMGDQPLDVLRTTVATSGYLNNIIETTSRGGPLSANGLFTRGAPVNGNVEAGSVTGAGAINGTLTSPAPAKPMPDRTIFEAYKRLATPLPWVGSTNNWTMNAPLLSATTNPYGTGTNANGIYYVNVPLNSTLKIQTLHTKGTLVVDCQDRAQVEVSQPQFWEPNSPDLPILLVRHLTAAPAFDWIAPFAGTVTEGGITYPSQLKGLVHVIGAAGAPPGNQVVTLGNGGTCQGTLIIDENAKIESLSARFNWDVNLKVNPPIGYSTGATMKVVTGTLQWEAAP